MRQCLLIAYLYSVISAVSKIRRLTQANREKLLPTPTMSVGVGRTFGVFCLFVSLSVCLFVRSITQKRMIPKCSN